NAIYMSITAEENSNQLVLGNKIKQELDVLKSAFPTGYEVHIGYDATEYIKAEMNKIYFRIGLTLIVLLLFVSFAYSSFRYTLLIVSSLFANLAVAVIFYYWFRLEIQLYSLAGITISMTLIIDNTIVMADHLIRRSNRLAFTSILAATVTTVGALSVIFFLDERLRLTLQDFAAVVILNLVISLFVALFLVPALMDKIGLLRKQRKFQLTKKKTLNIYFFRFYGLLCQFLYRWKVIVVIMLVLAFGLPVFLLPNKVEGSSVWASLYNKSFGTPYYKEHISLYANQLLGGAWRLFSEKVYTGSYFASREETRLYIRASLPSHATIQEMDALIQHMEGHIGRFIEVRQFRTNIHNGQRATIDIQFAEDYAKTGFPYFLKEYLISRSLELGGGSWRIYGVGDGFSNDLREGAGAYRLELFGFNFDELSGWARKIKDNLEQHRRINEVTIGSEFSWYKNDYEEFIFELDKQRLAEENIQPYQLYEQLKLVFAEDISLGRMVTSAGLEPLYISSKQSKEYNQWGLLHMPVKVNNKEYKVAELAQIKKSQVAQEVGKINQEYRLCLQYEYIGASEPGKRVLENFVKEFQEDLPVGYRVQIPDDYRLDHESYKQYGLLLLIVVIIYFVSSILFNSLKQPLYIISVVPISYIGIFMSFYLFKINFDQGGLASFILLSGLAINANIYIIDEYNHLRKKRKHISRLKAYQKAWGAKAKPIFLTVLSTILGFSPFLIGESKEVFWFPLAVGTIGGLIVSTLATFLFLPLFMGVGKTGDTHP
ncbi:MAG TPA: efflux RND transporter permease subunit, partial [Sphingobacteriaceae bacterium]|nr:efflux RND transporter permease subunit [Sphingobacteriaceae bacterium]